VIEIRGLKLLKILSNTFFEFLNDFTIFKTPKFFNMKIAIVGHGNVGGTLASSLVSNHQVTIGARNPESSKLSKLKKNPDLKFKSIKEAVSDSEVVIVAIPANLVTELIPSLGDLTGKVIIDATNAVRTKPDPYSTAFHAFKELTNAEVVKCFNTTGFENMSNPNYGAMMIDMFMAGNDTKAKTIARRLALDAGFAQCYDFGDESKVELLEQFALCWINLAIMQNMGRDIAFKLLKR
jgi:8-hydroxy-5-deazaflavin:NADPH oxidoreductase